VVGVEAGEGRPRSVAVILTAYRQPRWLRKSLWGYASQTFRDFELLVADDGSGEETARVLEEIGSQTDLSLRHVWQEDRGFRKCRVLNRAILATDAEYLVFSDGDCIPRDDFVATHVRLADRKRFLGGGALRLPRSAAERISREDIESGRAFRLGWLVRRGWNPGHRVLRLTRRRWLAVLLDGITPSRSVFNGGNGSVWREAALAVNGFDEEMGYGGQDHAFGDRLEHLGLRCRQVRHQAVIVHLEHERPYGTQEAKDRSYRIRQRIWRNEEIRARVGLDELRSDAGVEPGGSGKSGSAREAET
jgi:glycosyltransferase involved in cell wall biosynthesis